MPRFAIVVATDEAGGIGRNGQLPWHLKGDLAHFKKLTTAPLAPGLRNAVIMGRVTWDSIPGAFRPLTDRINVVISRNQQFPLPDGVARADSLEDALSQLDARTGLGRVFVIGGAQIYRSAMVDPNLERVYLTRVYGTMDCDTYFPAFSSALELVARSEPKTESQSTYEFRVYEVTKPDAG